LPYLPTPPAPPARSPALPARTTWPAESCGEVQLPRPPRMQSLAQLLGIHLRVAGRPIRFADEHRRRFVRAIPPAPLDVHRHEDIRTQHANQTHVVADDRVASPFVDHFFGIERVAVVDRAREVLLGR